MEVNELIAAQRFEGRFGVGKLGVGWGGFEEELQEEGRVISDGFERDQKRSEGVFDWKTLVLAQRARKAKKRVALGRKYKASVERERAEAEAQGSHTVSNTQA